MGQVGEVFTSPQAALISYIKPTHLYTFSTLLSLSATRAHSCRRKIKLYKLLSCQGISVYYHARWSLVEKGSRGFESLPLRHFLSARSSAG